MYNSPSIFDLLFRYDRQSFSSCEACANSSSSPSLTLRISFRGRARPFSPSTTFTHSSIPSNFSSHLSGPKDTRRCQTSGQTRSFGSASSSWTQSAGCQYRVLSLSHAPSGPLEQATSYSFVYKRAPSSTSLTQHKTIVSSVSRGKPKWPSLSIVVDLLMIPSD